MKSFLRVLPSLLLCACATTEPRSSYRDDALEMEAQRYESIAKSLEMKGPTPAAQGYREKAASVRAEKRSQPSMSDTLTKSAFDSLFDFVLFKGERSAR